MPAEAKPVSAPQDSGPYPQLEADRRKRFSAMAENPPSAKFKPDMPNIPGVATGTRSRRKNPLMPLIIGVVVLGFFLLLFAARWLSRPRTEPARVEAPQMEIPAPPPDPLAALPHADADHPGIAQIGDLAKPWSSVNFFIRGFTTGEEQMATIVRLPGSLATQPSGYWAFSRKAPYGGCQLEFITDMNRLRNEYGYHNPTHPLAGNPCTHTLYDPLKTANLPGNTWIRGAIVQGSDVRPPLGVELQIRGKEILATRTE
jgi:hypothetical protein